jgi:hypothetical protein
MGPPRQQSINKIKQFSWPISIVKSNLRKLQAVKKIVKSNKKLKKSKKKLGITLKKLGITLGF